jgi:tRNA dimethylallyltransferase
VPAPALIAVFGPTGVGKTAVAIALAERLRRRGERPVAVSADALAVYAGLEILTGAPTGPERERLEHRLVSFVPIDARFSVGQYAQLAHAEIDELLAAGRRPIVVGGTGLYLRAALTDLDLPPPPRTGVRERWEAALERQGPGELHRQLLRRAPWSAERIHPGDGRRLVRALELLETGQLAPPPRESQLWTEEVRHPTLLAGLVMDRARLHPRLDARVDAMVAAGARQQVLRAQARGASDTARQALGYQELLAGDVEAMKRATRRYAKRQLTWMRKLAGLTLIDVSGREPQDVAAEIDELAAPS